MNHYLMFFFLFVGYATIVYVRQSVSYASPVIAETEDLKNSELGLILSSQQLGYTFIKFIGGALVDILDPGLTFVACLLLTGLTCAAFTAVSGVTFFVILWFLCGMAQGPSWSTCAVLIKQNFPADQFATWWSILSTSSNVAGTAGPFVSQAIVSTYNWRASLLAAATSSLGLGIMCFFFFTGSSSSGDKNASKEKVKNLPYRALFNPLLVLLCTNYLLVSVVRGACNDWGQLYLIKNKGQSLLAGSSFISSQEVGGIIGSIVAGYLSDYLTSKEPGNARPRLTITAFLTVLQTVALYPLIFHTHSDTSQIWTNFFSFFIGFGMYGSISLIGVASMETAPENLSGTAHSFATLGGNLGRVLAGYPLSLIATWMSWHESFLAVLIISCISICVSFTCIKMLDLKVRTETITKAS